MASLWLVAKVLTYSARRRLLVASWTAFEPGDERAGPAVHVGVDGVLA